MVKQMTVSITLHENIQKKKIPYMVIGDENDEKGVVILQIGKNTYDKLQKLMTDGEAEQPGKKDETGEDNPDEASGQRNEGDSVENNSTKRGRGNRGGDK